MTIVIYSTLIILLCFAWKYKGIKNYGYNVHIFNILILLYFIIFVTFRDGNLLPDYSEYIDMFYNPEVRAVEQSFIIISDLSKTFSFGLIGMFFIYAFISISIRYYAIYKHSPFFLFSLCIWISSFLILHDMIQIRGAVSSALMLIIIPLLYEKKYIKSFILTILAFCFHRSALCLFAIFFLKPDRINKKIWISFYLIAIVINITFSDIISSLGINEVLSMIKLIENDGYDLGKTFETLSMFGPYILLQSITYIFCLIKIDKILPHYPQAILCIKIGFLSVIIYSLPLGVVSLRIAELLSTVYIYAFPLLLYVLPQQNNRFVGKLALSLISISLLTYFVFIKEFIA